MSIVDASPRDVRRMVIIVSTTLVAALIALMIFSLTLDYKHEERIKKICQINGMRHDSYTRVEGRLQETTHFCVDFSGKVYWPESLDTGKQ